MDTSLPELCYIHIRGNEFGKRIGIVKRGELGYYVTNYDNVKVSNKKIDEIVDFFNIRMGVTKEQAACMEIGSMFGWDVLAAYLEENRHLAMPSQEGR